MLCQGSLDRRRGRQVRGFPGVTDLQGAGGRWDDTGTGCRMMIRDG